MTEICRRLDGIPLAIELAASRMQSMTVLELRERLDDRFRLLIGSRRGLERHQTLRHAVQWSYDLLEDTEAALLQRCSVFTGGFDRAGAYAVSGADDEYAVSESLDSLVRKSLVVVNTVSGRTRFSMLETIRQFAEEQLVADGSAERTRGVHARFFARRSRELLDVWDGPRQRQAYEWVVTELANLRAGFRWAADCGELDTSAAIAFSTGFLGFWVETARTDRVGRGTSPTGNRRPAPTTGAALRGVRVLFRERTCRSLVAESRQEIDAAASGEATV